MDLDDLADRLERNEVLHLRYLCPLRSSNGGDVRCEERVGELLDVEVETGRLFVRCNGVVIWIKPEEAIALIESKSRPRRRR